MTFIENAYKELQRWIHSPSFLNSRDQARDARAPGTANWIFKDPTYIRWIKGSLDSGDDLYQYGCGALWINGKLRSVTNSDTMVTLPQAIQARAKQSLRHLSSISSKTTCPKIRPKHDRKCSITSLTANPSLSIPIQLLQRTDQSWPSYCPGMPTIQKSLTSSSSLNGMRKVKCRHLILK